MRSARSLNVVLVPLLVSILVGMSVLTACTSAAPTPQSTVKPAESKGTPAAATTAPAKPAEAAKPAETKPAAATPATAAKPAEAAKPAAPTKEVTWRMQSIYPATDLSTSVQGKMVMDTLNQKLAGKLKINMFLPGQIVPEEEMFDALGKGVFDAAITGAPWQAGILPEGMVAFGLPMGWQNVDQLFEFFYKYGFLKFMRDAHEKYNVFYAAPLPASPLPIISNFPMRKVDDIKGKKIWAMGGNSAYVQKLGGTPVGFPPAEMYMGLKLGTIDGAIYSLAELETSKYKEVVKYINWPAVVDPLAVEFLINKKAWDALSPDVQKVIEDTLVEIGPPMFKKYAESDNAGVEAAKQYGVQEVQLDEAELPKARAAAAEVWKDTAAKSDNAAKAVQMLKDYLATKGVRID